MLFFEGDIGLISYECVCMCGDGVCATSVSFAVWCRAALCGGCVLFMHWLYAELKVRVLSVF